MWKLEEAYMMHKIDAIVSDKLITSLVFSAVLLLPFITLSAILFFGYKASKAQFKKPKYGRFRYKYILWRLIFVKSIILVPIVSWVLNVISKVTSDSTPYSPVSTTALFFWWGTIFVYRTLYRKFFRKSIGGKREKSPTPFYNDKK